jgi:hypothetical protein
VGSFWIDDSEGTDVRIGQDPGSIYAQITTQDGRPQSFFLTRQDALFVSNHNIVPTMCRAEKAKLSELRGVSITLY